MMRRKSRTEVPAGVRAVQVRYSRWRKAKRGRGRSPGQLWSTAVRLCRRHSVNRVSRWLGLNHTALQERVKVDTGQKDGRSKHDPVFVELASGTTSSVSEYLVESGGVRVRLRGASVADVIAVARSLREQDAK